MKCLQRSDDNKPWPWTKTNDIVSKCKAYVTGLLEIITTISGVVHDYQPIQSIKTYAFSDLSLPYTTDFYDILSFFG